MSYPDVMEQKSSLGFYYDKFGSRWNFLSGSFQRLPFLYFLLLTALQSQLSYLFEFTCKICLKPKKTCNSTDGCHQYHYKNSGKYRFRTKLILLFFFAIFLLLPCINFVKYIKLFDLFQQSSML